MALIKCYECSKEISDKAPACPHCGAPKEGQPPQIEEAEILESVAVVDEPEPISQETVSAPPTEPEPVATKNERFNHPMAFVVGIFVFQIVRSLGMNYPLTVVFLLVPWALLVRYGKKQSPQAYAGIIGALVVMFGIAVAAGPGSQRDARWAHSPVNVRSGRSTSDSIVTGLERGERIEVDNLVDGWFRVFRNGEPIGYSASSVLNEGPPSSERPEASYPSSIDSWLTEWSTRQAASIQESCRAESACDPDQYAPSARPETSFGWDGAQSVQQTDDWARGPRYQVTANGRSVLIYLEEGDVVSVYLHTSDGGRTNLCRDGSCE